MERIRAPVENIIRELTTQKKANKESAPEVWLKKTLTRKELGHIKFHYFRQGVLGVRVDSSAWKYSLSLKKANLLMKLQGYAPEIKELRFSVGDIE